METLYIYLIKSSALIGMFYLAYYFFLRKETFFTSNRWFLIAGLITSVILPFIIFTKIIWVEPAPTNFDWSKNPVTHTPIAEETFEINWYLVLVSSYCLGIVAFLAKFAIDFYSLTKVLKSKTIQQQADFKFIDHAESVSPFSYFNYIVYNSALYSPSELENILAHEKVHSEQHHTIDVLIARIFCIFFWYNPFVWFYKKAILQNLEYIADSVATQTISDKKAYQITLLKVTTHENCVAITNHFYQSLIKKRIVMLNKNQSDKRNSWKYVLVLPALAAFMFYFQTEVVAQEKERVKQEITSENVVYVTVNKNSTEEEMKKDAELLKKEYGITLKFSKIKRNSNGEITAIKVEYKDKNGRKGITQIDGDEPIKPIQFYKADDKIGFGSAREARTHKREVGNNNDDDNDFDLSLNDDIADLDMPEPPTPPASPAMPNMPHMQDIPNIPAFPKLPNFPSIPHNMNDPKAMKKHEMAMKEYELEMEKLKPEMEAFEKEMAKFDVEMGKNAPNMEAFEKSMEVFEKEMEAFGKKMEAFNEQMEKKHPKNN